MMIMVVRRPLSGVVHDAIRVRECQRQRNDHHQRAEHDGAGTDAKLRTERHLPTNDERRAASSRSAATMTTNITRRAAHAHAASGLAYQLASDQHDANGGQCRCGPEEIQLGAMSGFSFDGPLGHLVVSDASGPFRFQAPPEGLGKAEQRLLQDRHHQPVDDRPAGFLRFDEPGLLQHGEMGRHGRLRHGEVIRQFSRRHRPLAASNCSTRRRVGSDSALNTLFTNLYLANNRNDCQARTISTRASCQ